MVTENQIDILLDDWEDLLSSHPNVCLDQFLQEQQAALDDASKSTFITKAKAFEIGV